MIVHTLLLFLLMTGATGISSDPIARALERFNEIESYSVTLRSYSRDHDIKEVIRYYYKKPENIRMEFEKPHKGAILVYNNKTGKVSLMPFPVIKIFVLNLDPYSFLIRSSKGHTVKESDIGDLLRYANILKEDGMMELIGEERLSGRKSMVVRISGVDGFTILDGINRYIIWIDKDLGLPIKAEAFDIDGRLIEGVLMDDLEVDVDLPDGFFELR